MTTDTPSTHKSDLPAATAPRERAWSTMPRGQPQSSETYSRFVGWMKIILPVAALFIVSTVIVYSTLPNANSNISLNIEEIKEVGDDLEMTQPKLTFTDKKDRDYLVVADTAVQSQDNQDVWDLKDIDADLTPQNGGWIKLTSTSGILHSQKEELDLMGVVDVTSHDGYEFHAVTAKVDFGEGTVMSEDPVKGSGPGGAISADSFSMVEGGNLITFTGDVQLRVMPGSDDNAGLGWR